MGGPNAVDVFCLRDEVQFYQKRPKKWYFSI